MPAGLILLVGLHSFTAKLLFNIDMTTPPPNTSRMQNAGSFPPRRGRVKAQIFESLAVNLSFVASKATQVLVNAKGGSSSAASASTSATASPPQSSYASDGCPDQA
ncbi:hypothetical protein CASFOL_002774 [Castilleja foliolosa]|uniref:Uncharacterized protein n=1 Tax=Castilleja foliolosa TaxID=1961234 RepID=A0ABD3EF87_9LAMI